MLELTDDDIAQYERAGLIGPFPLVDDGLRADLVRDARVLDRRASWYRGLHDFDSSVLHLGQRPDVVAAVSQLLGPDLLLWGSELARRVPGEGHHWHNDVEALNGPTLNVWVGLANLGPEAPFLYVPGSHRWGVVPQDLFPPDQRELHDDEVLLEISRRYDPDAVVAHVIAEAGDAILFNGTVWHGTRNNGSRMRKALTLHYTSTSTAVRRPVTYTTPVEWHPDPVPCVLVAGEDRHHLNPVAEPVRPTFLARVDGVITAWEEAIRDVILRTKGRAHA